MTAIPPPALAWHEWEDRLGQKYRRGDFVAYAYVAGQSAGMQFGYVDTINKFRKNGTPLETQSYDRTTKQYTTVPSCSIRVIPIQKFKGKWTDRKIDYNGGNPILLDGLVSPKTWQLPNNVIKIAPVELIP